MAGEQDPIEAMDLSDMGQMVAESETAIPDSMILGGPRGDESTATAGEEEEAADGEETAADVARDASGKFAKKEGDEPDGDADPDLDPAAAKAAKRSPFEYRAVGANHTLPGAELDDAGNLTIKAEQVGTVRQALNAFHLAQSGQDAVLPAIRARDTQIAEITAKHEQTALLASIAEELITKAESAFNEPDEEKALAAFYQLRQNWRGEMAASEAKFWRAQAERGKQPNRATAAAPTGKENGTTAEAAALPSTEDALATTTEYVEQMKFLPNYRTALTPQDWKQYAERIARMPYAFLRPATAAEAQERGLRVGQTVFDTDKLKQDVDDFVSSRALARKKAQSQTGLAANNARRTQPSIAAPPTPGSGRQPVGAKKSGNFGSEKEVDNWLGNDEL